MKFPLIAVSTSVTVDKYPERAYVNASYLNAVQQAGGENGFRGAHACSHR